jgi:hypothetical protein
MCETNLIELDGPRDKSNYRDFHNAFLMIAKIIRQKISKEPATFLPDT